MYDSKIEKTYHEPKRGGCADCSYDTCTSYCEGFCTGSCSSACAFDCTGSCETNTGITAVNGAKE